MDQNNSNPTKPSTETHVVSDSYTGSRVRAVVMRRVRTIHLLQSLFSPTTFSVAVFVAALWGIGREVWVARVLQDEPSANIGDIGAVAHFYLLAFLDTRLIVQALSIVALGALLYLLYSSSRSIRGLQMVSFWLSQLLF